MKSKYTFVKQCSFNGKTIFDLIYNETVILYFKNYILSKCWFPNADDF